MKIRMKTWQIALCLFVAALLPLCVISTKRINAQVPQARYQTADIRPDVGVCKGNHRSRKDFYQNVRMLPPSTVLEVIGNRVNYAVAEEGIELGSLELEGGYSVVAKEFSRDNHSGCYAVTYCETHKVILLLDVLPQNMCGITKQ